MLCVNCPSNYIPTSNAYIKFNLTKLELESNGGVQSKNDTVKVHFDPVIPRAYTFGIRNEELI